MQQDHIVKIYDKELADLDRLIADMGDKVSTALKNSVACLLSLDTSAAEQVVLEDKAIDALESEIVAHATRLLALRQPMAADLRTVIASLRIVNDLERMGDYAKNIAKRVKTFSQLPSQPDAAKSVERMGDLVDEMIRQVLRAYRKRDTEQALEVIKKDTGVDQLYTALFRETLTYMMEDPRTITICTHFLFITKNIERIGDHATNIAEQVYYIVTGEHLDDSHISEDKSSTMKVDARSQAPKKDP